MNIRIFNKISICFILGIAFSIVAYVTSQSNNYTTQELAEIAQTKLHQKENNSINNKKASIYFT